MINTATGSFGAAVTAMIILWIIGLGILVGTVALITWVVKKVWYAGSLTAISITGTLVTGENLNSDPSSIYCVNFINLCHIQSLPSFC